MTVGTTKIAASAEQGGCNFPRVVEQCRFDPALDVHLAHVYRRLDTIGLAVLKLLTLALVGDWRPRLEQAWVSPSYGVRQAATTVFVAAACDLPKEVEFAFRPGRIGHEQHGLEAEQVALR